MKVHQLDAVQLNPQGFGAGTAASVVTQFLDTNSRHVEKGAALVAAGDKISALYAVHRGWLLESTTLACGSRRVVRTFLPGELIGLTSLALQTASCDIVTVTDCVVSCLDLTTVSWIFRERPEVAAYLFGILAREQTVLMDLIRASGRLRPCERLAYLLLDFSCRLCTSGDSAVASFNLPLSQRDLGDSVGLTNVTISRTLSQMVEEGLIGKEQGRIQLRDEDALRALCDYQDRYEAADTSW